MGRVIWIIDDPTRARELFDYLHRNWPGGNQDMTDELGNAIFRAEAPSPPTGPRGPSRGDLYLQQMRTVFAELQASQDKEDGHEETHYQHLAGTWQELDRACAAGEIPREWKQQFYNAREQ